MGDVIRATVIVDASYCQSSRAAGWAGWIRVDGINDAIRLSAGIARPLVNSSTDAEVRAACFGAAAAIERGATHVLLQSDCQTVCTLNHHVWRGFAALHPGVIFEARHVKGHTADPAARSWVNRWCDTNAKREMRAKRRVLKPARRGRQVANA